VVAFSLGQIGTPEGLFELLMVYGCVLWSFLVHYPAKSTTAKWCGRAAQSCVRLDIIGASYDGMWHPVSDSLPGGESVPLRSAGLREPAKCACF